jgi:hypothetical protein
MQRDRRVSAGLEIGRKCIRRRNDPSGKLPYNQLIGLVLARVSSLRFPTQPGTTFGRRELLFHPHPEQDLINQVIAILLRQRREAKQEPVIHGRENCIDQ